MNPVTVHLPQDWISRIDDLAEREERTRQGQLRILIRTALEHVAPTTEEAAERKEITA